MHHMFKMADGGMQPGMEQQGAPAQGGGEMDVAQAEQILKQIVQAAQSGQISPDMLDAVQQIIQALQSSQDPKAQQVLQQAEAIGQALQQTMEQQGQGGGGGAEQGAPAPDQGGQPMG